MSSTEPTNEELAKGYAKQIEQAQERREAKDLERLERHGRAAAQQSQAIEAEQKQGQQGQQGQGVELDSGQKVELDEINGQQARTLAKELNRDNEKGDQVKEARAREIAERFKEKAARDREQSRSFSR
ncbi:hypothetical protein J4G52_37815 [Burkholderia cenocepacia]|uniref:hypothetical protein n=1 Tax=Burkholderia cenocepacia TaxID=95486 RepID=UPI001AA1B982|nr:hypothetical protein [Burkholderia cenocepacia]MBO1859317.1 hypothetical protein [Burkholderia cenocepacia]